MFEIPEKPGAILTRDHVLFSWALAESFSPRWQGQMQAEMSDALKRKLDAGETRDYSEAERQAMIGMLAAQKNRASYIRDYIDPAHEFRLLEMPVEALEWLAVFPTFGWKKYPVPLSHFVDWGAIANNSDDPRTMAARFLDNPPDSPYAGYPMIGYDQTLKSDVLFEGYARCIAALLRRRRGETVAPMRLIYCAIAEDKKTRAYYTEKY